LHWVEGSLVFNKTVNFSIMSEDRKLAAIMFTDIVGYTALMGSDEDKAFDMLKRNHAIHETIIKKRNDKLITDFN